MRRQNPIIHVITSVKRIILLLTGVILLGLSFGGRTVIPPDSPLSVVIPLQAGLLGLECILLGSMKLHLRLRNILAAIITCSALLVLVYALRHVNGALLTLVVGTAGILATWLIYRFSQQ